jgi:hypothetical protein
MCCDELLRENFLRSVPGRKQVAVEPFKFAINFLLTNYRFDTRNRRRMAVRCKASALFPMNSFNFEVAVVYGVGQVGCRALCHAAADGAVIQNDNPLTLSLQQVRSRYARYPRSDNGNVGLGITGQR